MELDKFLNDVRGKNSGLGAFCFGGESCRRFDSFCVSYRNDARRGSYGESGRLHPDTAAPPCSAASAEASPQCWGENGFLFILFSLNLTPSLPAPLPELGEAGRGLLRWRSGRLHRPSITPTEPSTAGQWRAFAADVLHPRMAGKAMHPLQKVRFAVGPLHPTAECRILRPNKLPGVSGNRCWTEMIPFEPDPVCTGEGRPAVLPFWLARHASATLLPRRRIFYLGRNHTQAAIAKQRTQQPINQS